MSATKAQKVRLGIFGIAAAAALALVLVVFGGFRFWQSRDEFAIYFDDSVMGLEQGAEVTFAGIRVGSVSKIELVPDDLAKVKVTINVKEGLPIRTDTKATLQFAGITGLKAIDLRGGTAGAPRLPDGGTIATGETLVDRFEKTAEIMAKRSEELMNGAGAVMTNLEATSAELHAMVAENREALSGTIGAVGVAARHASALLDQDLPKLVTSAGTLVEDMRRIVRSNEVHVRTAMFDLRQASRNFKDLSRDLKQRPSQLLFSKSSGDRKLP